MANRKKRDYVLGFTAINSHRHTKVVNGVSSVLKENYKISLIYKKKSRELY